MELSAVNDVHQTSPASLLADLATGQTKDQSGGPHEGLGKVLHRTHLPAITRAMNEWQAMKAQPSDTEARNPMHKTRFTEKRHAPVDQSHVVSMSQSMSSTTTAISLDMMRNWLWNGPDNPAS